MNIDKSAESITLNTYEKPGKSDFFVPDDLLVKKTRYHLLDIRIKYQEFINNELEGEKLKRQRIIKKYQKEKKAAGGYVRPNEFSKFANFIHCPRDLFTNLSSEICYPSVWKIGIDENDLPWSECVEHSYISLTGWDAIVNIQEVSWNDFEEKARQIYSVSENKKLERQGVFQLWRFAKQIKNGDFVIVNQGEKKILGVGLVCSDFRSCENQKNHHRYSVKWIDTQERDIDKRGWRRQFLKLDLRTLQKLLKKTHDHKAYSYTLKDFLKDTNLDASISKKLISSLLRKQHIIIAGVPGAGKSFISDKLARCIQDGEDGLVETCQFHPAYTYEDFIQGLRPLTNSEGTLKYEIVLGRFLSFCEKARNYDENCVLIIDEINRANLSAVFGELMYLLEYRDQEIKLAGSNEPFSIPENVYIIGTMNTADRSIALVDHALRRRFAFIELRPDYNILRKWHEREETGFDVEPLITQIEKVNESIGDRHYHLGISYFLDAELTENIADIWELEIYPYLEELFYGEPEKLEQFTWENIRSSVLGETEA